MERCFVTGVVFLYLNVQGEIPKAEIAAGLPVFRNMLMKRPSKVIIIPSALAVADVETIKEYVAETAAFKLKEGIVIQNLAQRILGNFLIRNTANRLPVKLFSSKEEALSWLNED